LLAKRLCSDAKIEATIEVLENEDGHVRVYPPAGLRKKKSPISKESSPIDASIFWSKRAFLFAPRFMTERTAECPLIEL
jgi:hypothetical protein